MASVEEAVSDVAEVIGAAGIVLLDAVEDSVVKAEDVLKDPDKTV